MTCPHCGQAAEFHSHRRHTCFSLVGPLRYRRACCLCRLCAKGLFPFDRTAGLTTRDLTPALERITTLAGAVADSFEKGVSSSQSRSRDGCRSNAAAILLRADTCLFQQVANLTTCTICLRQGRRPSFWGQEPCTQLTSLPIATPLDHSEIDVGPMTESGSPALLILLARFLRPRPRWPSISREGGGR